MTAWPSQQENENDSKVATLRPSADGRRRSAKGGRRGLFPLPQRAIPTAPARGGRSALKHAHRGYQFSMTCNDFLGSYPGRRDLKTVQSLVIHV
jgi:hypothetical protein